MALDETRQLHSAFKRGGPAGAASQWWHEYTAFAPSTEAQLALRQGRPAVHLHTFAFAEQKLGDVRALYQDGREAYDRYVDNRRGKR